MSVKRNIAANYVSQFFVAAVGILVVPLYLGILGAESYGLIAFFTLVQSWFTLLDLGLTSTITREAARFSGSGSDALLLRRLLRSLEGVVWSIGIVAALSLMVMADALASRWLNVRSLPGDVVEMSILFIALTVAARWISGLYRGVLIGLERLVWLSWFNIAIVTARFGAPLLFIRYADTGVVAFFAWQVLISMAEMFVLIRFNYTLVRVPRGTRIGWSLAPLRGLIGFSATVAFTSVVGISIGQIDKVLLSTLVSLQEFGFFTATALLASGVTLVSAPITLALLPRMTALAQAGDPARVQSLYRKATQVTAAIAGSAALLLASAAEKVIWVWTGNQQFAAAYSEVLTLYALGNGFLAFAAFPYYLQYAYGDLRLHLMGNAAFLVALVPAIAIATLKFGVLGAGTAWLAANALFFFAWTGFIHRRFAPGLHKNWIIKDVFGALAVPLVLALLLVCVNAVPLHRATWAAILVGVACAMVGGASLTASLIRKQVAAKVLRFVPMARC